MLIYSNCCSSVSFKIIIIFSWIIIERNTDNRNGFINSKLMLCNCICLVSCHICISNIKCIITVSGIYNCSCVGITVRIFSCCNSMFCPIANLRNYIICICNFVINILRIKVSFGNSNCSCSVSLKEFCVVVWSMVIIIILYLDSRVSFVNTQSLFLSRNITCPVCQFNTDFNIVTVVLYSNSRRCLGNNIRIIRYNFPIACIPVPI